MKYGQFCPVSKAAELLCERWTLLIVRELLLGSKRYSEFQRAISKISPTLLSKRLSELEAADIVFKEKIQGARGYEYFLSKAGKELGPIVVLLGKWGMQWSKSQLTDDELDVELLIWDIQRRLDQEYFPNEKAVLQFTFTDLENYAKWWIVVDGTSRDVCTEDPGLDVSVYFTSDIRTMIRVWSGEKTVRCATNSDQLKIVGNNKLIQSLRHWFLLSMLIDK